MRKNFIEAKYAGIKYNSEELQKALQILTNKINNLNEEYEIVQELYENSLKFK